MFMFRDAYLIGDGCGHVYTLIHNKMCQCTIYIIRYNSHMIGIETGAVDMNITQ